MDNLSKSAGRFATGVAILFPLVPRALGLQNLLSVRNSGRSLSVYPRFRVPREKPMRDPNSIALIGAAIAAAVTLPAKAADWTWVNRPAQTFPAHAVDLERVSADVTVRPAAAREGVTMTISGPRFLVDDVKAQAASGVLVDLRVEQFGGKFRRVGLVEMVRLLPSRRQE